MASDAQEKIGRLQMIEQNLQAMLGQKQQFQSQAFEIESALKELQTTTDAYKIVANLMIKTDKTKLVEDLTQKKEIADLRIKSMEKQEEQLREKAEGLRKDVLASMKE